MGGDLSIHNNTGVELIVTLSQVGPLHWARVPPHSTHTIECGQVWFTVKARLWDGNEPSGWDVAAPILLSTVAATGVVTAGAGVVVAATASGTAAAAGGGAMISAGAGAIGAGVGFAANLGSQANKSSGKTQVEEDTDKWLAHTPSVESAKWLAKNKVICITPVSEAGVYANGKTVSVDYHFTSSSEWNRMTLSFSGT